jgi:uncharacterized protein (DUF58 family)
MAHLARYVAVLDAGRGLEWPALRKVRPGRHGPHVSTARGSSAEFVEYRPYRQGDDPRKIDWKLVGRTDRFYTRRSPELANLPTMLLVDASGSMAFPQESVAKWRLACTIAIGLAAIARAAGDPVGLLALYQGGIQAVPPRSRVTVLEQMAGALAGTPGGNVTLTEEVARTTRNAGRVVVISDFLSETDGIRRIGRWLAAEGRELHAVHVVDRQELNPDPALRLLTDPEQPEVRRPLPHSARGEYLRRFAHWREELAQTCLGAGARYTMVTTDDTALRQTLRRIISAPGGTPASR